MNRADFLLWLGLVVAYQIYATVLVLRSDHFDDRVKRNQVIMIWLIPLVGAVLVRMRLNDAERSAKTDRGARR